MRVKSAPLAQRASLSTVKIEVAAASILTLCALALVLSHTRSRPASVKTSFQAVSPNTPAEISGNASLRSFMEQFALSHVASAPPEATVETYQPRIAPALIPAVAVAVIAAKVTSLPDAPQPKIRPAAFKPPVAAPVPAPRLALERRPVQLASGPRPAPTEPARVENRIPVLSAIAEKIPGPRDIANGVTSVANGVSNVGRKIGSLFGRG